MKKNGLKDNDGQIDGSKGRIDEIKGDRLSLSKISKDEIERLRRMRHIYIEKKMCGRQSNAFVRNEANENTTRVQNIKCIAARVTK